MLNADGIVIADKAQSADDVLPIEQIVAVADAAEDPGAVCFVCIALRVERAVLCHVVLIETGILCVYVEDCVAAELADNSNRIHALPNEVGRVKVCADLRAHSLTELEERLRVVNTEALVHFKSDLVDAVLFCECYKILPVIDKNLPLILEDLTEIVRPCAYNPVRILRGLAIARATGEAVDLMQAVFFSHQNCVAHVLIISRSQLLIRVDRVAVAGECADFHIILLDGIAELLILCFIVEQNFRIAVIFARIAAAADFDHLDAHGLEILQCVLKRHVAYNIGKYA